MKEVSKKIALIGNPNCGKSTLFNILTGLQQQVGNYPGVTVDRKTGKFSSTAGKEIFITDLPGTYSLFPKSIDEQIALQVLLDKNDISHPDLVLIVADASNLKRSLYLATQVIELGFSAIFVLNMTDISESKGIEINTTALSEYLGCEVVKMNARKAEGIEELKNLIEKPLNNALKKFLNHEFVIGEKNEDKFSFSELVLNFEKKFNFYSNDKVSQNEYFKKAISEESILRYRLLTDAIPKFVSKIKIDTSDTTKKIDHVLLHPVWGSLVFLAVLLFVFQVVFSFSEYPMQLIESLFSKATSLFKDYFPDGILKDLFADGIIAGISGIVVFIPQIALLFAFISILEDTGYMARVGFLTDRIMKPFGLNGRSVIPLVSGVACAVPAIMGTRTIANYKERILTVFVTPLMSCSARLPVYTLLSSLMIPENKYIFIFNERALLLVMFYLIGFVAALLVALVLKFIVKSKEKSYFIMEMPSYKMPRWNNVFLTMFEKVKVFLFDAGKVIIAISIILWWLSSFGPPQQMMKIESEYETKMALQPQHQDSLMSIMNSKKLESSYAGIAGKFIEPVISPLGFDWKMGIALITSFAAREVFVGTMATIYSVSDMEDVRSIRQKMADEKNRDTGEKVYTTATCLSLMFFYAFALQCMSTVAVVYRETKSKIWPFLQFISFGALAWIISFAVYHLVK